MNLHKFVFFIIQTIYIIFKEIEQVGLIDRKSSDKPLVAAFDLDKKYSMDKEFRFS